MKNLITVITILLGFTVSSQTRVDSLILKEINKYRAEKGMYALIWDTLAYKVSKNHTDYMVATGLIQHDQNVKPSEVGSTVDLPLYEDMGVKFKKQGLNNKTGSVDVVECAAANFIGENDPKITSDDSLAVLAVRMWKSSPEHNEAILSDTIVYAATSFGIGHKHSVLLESIDDTTGEWIRDLQVWDDVISYFFCFEAYSKEY